MEPRRPLWPLVTAAVVLLPVLYVASFGPACWLYGRMSNAPYFLAMYSPIGAVISGGPEPLSRALYWYGVVGLPRRVAIAIPVMTFGEGATALMIVAD